MSVIVTGPIYRAPVAPHPQCDAAIRRAMRLDPDGLAAGQGQTFGQYLRIVLLRRMNVLTLGTNAGKSYFC